VKILGNKNLKDAAIDLDDHYFKSCTLIGCTLSRLCLACAASSLEDVFLSFLNGSKK
jgi:hypothetical protein